MRPILVLKTEKVIYEYDKSNLSFQTFLRSLDECKAFVS